MSGNGYKPGTDLASRQPIQDLSWWHHAILDWMISNPDKKLAQAAAFFDVSQAWLSIVINSDAFQERLTDRQQMLASAVNQDTVTRLQGVADTALDVMQEQLELKRDTLPIAEVRETADMALKALGFGAPAGGARGRNGTSIGQMNVIVGGASAESLDRSRDLMRKVSQVVEHDADDTDTTAVAVPSST